jgi:ADP-heptose:LPS heptosyltransferase
MKRKKEMKRILVVLWGAMGDIIRVTPMLRALKKSMPHTRIYFLVADEFKDVLEGNKNIDELLIAKGFYKRKRNYIDILNIISKLRKTRFDVVINLRPTYLMHAFSMLLNADMRIGFLEGGGRINNFYIRLKDVKTIHAAERFLKVAELIGVKSDRLEYDIFIKKEEEQFINNLLKSNGVKSKDMLIGFSFGGDVGTAYGRNRRWPIANWISLSEMIKNEYPTAKIILVGDKLDYIESKAFGEEERIINFCGMLKKRETFALLKQLNYLISTDNGVMNAGSALTTVIGLFGPSSPIVDGPVGKRHLMIWNKIKCGPCGVKVNCKNNECMKQMHPKKIFNIVTKKIKEGKNFGGLIYV